MKRLEARMLERPTPLEFMNVAEKPNWMYRTNGSWFIVAGTTLFVGSLIASILRK